MFQSRWLFALGALAAAGALAQTSVPTKLAFTARLVDNGTPVSGNRDFVFKLFPTIVGGSEVWLETRSAVAVADGQVNLELGASTPLTDTLFDGQTFYLEVSIGGTTLSPRTPVLSVPYALRSNVASRLGALTEPDIQKRVGTSCVAGSAIRGINADGTVTCQAAAITVTDAGIVGITGVYGGAGLTGGAATGDVNLAVSFAGSGTATTVARSDHTHAGTYLPKGPTLACSGTDKMVSIDGNSGSVVCAADSSASYSALLNGGLALTSGNQFSLTSCSPNQILVAGNGGSWACGTPAAAGIASISVTAPLTSSGGANPTLALGTVPVANGGTGSTTAASARTALGTAASGANTDITSLAGLTTPLSAAQGGTGLAAPTAAGSYLKSTAGGWATGTIQASEIPSLATSYIANQGVAAQGGSLYVDGTIRTKGLMRSGSETGTTQPPRVDVSGGYQGTVLRAINSVFNTAGQIVARTDLLTFERDGTSNGFRVTKVTSDTQRGYVTCQGFDTGGTTHNKVINIPAGVLANTSYAVFSDAENMVHMSCNFGTLDTATSNVWHHTSITLSRTDTGYYWAGMLQSTFNQ